MATAETYFLRCPDADLILRYDDAVSTGTGEEIRYKLINLEFTNKTGRRAAISVQADSTARIVRSSTVANTLTIAFVGTRFWVDPGWSVSFG